MAFQNRALLNTMAQYTGGEDQSRSLKMGENIKSVFFSLFLNFEDPYILKSVKETNAMYFNQSGAFPITRFPAPDNRTT